MGFLGELIEGAIENKFGGGHSSSTAEPSYGGEGSYGNSSYGQAPPPPQVYPPWVARWDAREGRYFFVNEQTGERTWEYPASQGGYGGGGEYRREESYGGEYRGEYRGKSHQQEPPKEDHSLTYGVAGLAAGAVGGALLMHEGEKIHEDWDEDKDRIENNVADFPEDAARWTGEKVGEVEQIPDDIENDYDRAKYRVEDGFDNAVQDVEDAPEDVAGWVGEKVGDVERFDDNIENAYDQGEQEGRYDDNY
ncbi:hypothetical protein DTO282E5_3925 [Paecilomyces variotii]|nr:hypothetical protein DTO027B9_3992 [Paecilomyces variotii]KAJ9371318.1 hypothetical protein DTO282E5_3925 [Paecilomyces variotii]